MSLKPQLKVFLCVTLNAKGNPLQLKPENIREAFLIDFDVKTQNVKTQNAKRKNAKRKNAKTQNVKTQNVKTRNTFFSVNFIVSLCC
jgi:hypothetical protein